MAHIKLPLKRKKRRPGQRANLSRDQILVAALDLLQAKGVDGFTARRLAERLSVHPQAVLGRFKSFADLRRAAAARLLEVVAPPFAPGDEPADYIRGVFRRVLTSVPGRGAVADLAAVALSDSRMVAPLLLERLLVALRKEGVGEAALRPALDLVYAHLIGMLAVEAGERQVSPEAVRALPQGEFPNLHASMEELASAPPLVDVTEVADHYSAATLRGLALHGGAAK